MFLALSTKVTSGKGSSSVLSNNKKIHNYPSYIFDNSRGISTRRTLAYSVDPFRTYKAPLLFSSGRHSASDLFAWRDSKRPLFRSFAENNDNNNDKAATIDQLTSSFIKLVKNKELAEKEKEANLKKNMGRSQGDDILRASGEKEDKIVGELRPAGEEEEDEEDLSDEEAARMEEEEEREFYEPSTLEELLDRYTPEVAAHASSDPADDVAAYKRIIAESESLYSPNALVDLDPILEDGFNNAVEEWEAELEITGLNWKWLNFINDEDEEDWMEEENRFFATMPNAGTNWEAAWRHFHWIGDRYFW
jgi:hypothetical protein